MRKYSCPITEFRKILINNTTILDQQNSKDSRFLKPCTFEIKVPASIKLSTNIHKCLKLQLPYIELKPKSYTSINKKRYCTFAIYTPLMIAWVGSGCTWEPVKYGKFISQFQLDIKIYIQWYERIEIRIGSHRMFLIFNKIYEYIHTYGGGLWVSMIVLGCTFFLVSRNFL